MKITKEQRAARRQAFIRRRLAKMQETALYLTSPRGQREHGEFLQSLDRSKYFPHQSDRELNRGARHEAAIVG